MEQLILTDDDTDDRVRFIAFERFMTIPAFLIIPARYQTFALYLGLIALWNGIIGAFKIFFYTALGTLYPMTGYLSPSLEGIAGYISLGSIIAYLIGGALVVMFPRKIILAASALVSTLLFGVLWYIHFTPPWIFFTTTVVIGFFYGLFSIIRNSLVFVEMRELGRSDTFVNGIAVIVFIIAVIAGSYIGSYAYGHEARMTGIELFSTAFLGIAIIGYTLQYDTDTHNPNINFVGHIRENAVEFWKIFKRYIGIIMASALLWTVSTAIFQQMFQFAVHDLHRTNNAALELLVGSMIGGILGNIMTMGVTLYRFEKATVLTVILAIFIACIPLTMRLQM